MMTVDVDVENAWVDPEELEDAKDNVVNVAEARRFAFLCVVQSAGPVDCDVGCSAGKSLAGICKQ